MFEFRLLSDATVGKGRTPRFQQVEGFILLGGRRDGEHRLVQKLSLGFRRILQEILKKS